MTPFVTNKFWQNFTKNAIRRKKRKSLISLFSF